MEPLPPRNRAIDQFRGLSILLMAAANYMEHIRVVPPWLKHAPDIGITLIDFIAPAFLFAVGVNLGPSLRRRLQQGGAQSTFEHVVKRSMALVGIGALFSLGEASYGFSHASLPWGVLQAIGTSILLCSPLLRLPALTRLGLGLLLLAGYQYALGAWWLETVLHSSHAGIQGALSWTALLILSTALADAFGEGQTKRAVFTSVCLLVGGILTSLYFPISKHRMSAPFVLVSVASVALVYFMMAAADKKGVRFPAFLEPWGANPLVLYISHLLLLAVFLVPSWPRWHTEAPAWQAVVQGLAFIGLLYAWGWTLWKKRLIVKL